MKAFEHHVPASKCPYCGYLIDAAGPPTGETEPPGPGDFSVCIACTGILRFTRNLRLRKASLDDVGMDLQLVHQLIRLQEGIAHMKAKDPDWPGS